VKLILGLGNPGEKYQRSRHNAGFWVVDKIARRHKVPLNFPSHGSLIGSWRLGQEDIIAAKPQTFMNRSGEPARALLREYQLAPADMIVVYDDLDLSSGRIRIRPQGSAGGHRGMQSIVDHVGTNEFPRVRIGIGRPPPGLDAADYVLQPLEGEELTAFEAVTDRGAEALDFLLSRGLEPAMQQFNPAV
jgi:PTH1 family peptidyl-tRNA hydrolase